MKIENKIELFSEKVMREAFETKQAMEAEIAQKRKEALDECEREGLERAYSAVQKSVAEAERREKEKVSTASFRLKNRYIAERESLIDAVFATVLERLDRYRETDAYRDRLLQAVEEAKRYGKDVTVELRAEDAARLTDELKKHGVTDIRTAAIVGGLRAIVTDAGIAVDETFDTRLAELRRSFHVDAIE